MKIRIYCKLGGGIWESGSMKSYWWGSLRSPSVQFLGALCPVSPWPGLFPHLHIQGSYEGRGRRKRAECGPTVWLGGLWEAATHSHLHLMIWLTGDPSWQGRRHREYVVCVQAIVCPTESRASIPNKEETNHVLHSHGFQGGINYSLWSSRYTDICCLLSDLIIIILHISLLTLFLMNGEIWVGQVKVLDWSKKKKASSNPKACIYFKINNSLYLDVVPNIIKNTVFDKRKIAKICCSSFCFPKVNPQLQVCLGLFKWGAVSEARGWSASLVCCGFP